MTSFIKGVFSITSREAGKEIALALLAAGAVYLVKSYIDKNKRAGA